MEKDEVIYYQLNSEGASSHKGFRLLLELEKKSTNMTLYAINEKHQLEVKSDNLRECIREILREIDLIK